MKKVTFLTRGRDSWYVCDFETTTQETNYYKETQDTRVMLYHFKNITEEQEFTGVSIESFFNDVFSLNKSVTLFFHNLSFDGDFIVKYLHNKTDFKFTFKQKLENKEFKVFRNGGKIYYIHLFYRKRVGKSIKDINIFIRCSYMLLSTSVAQLGKSVNIEKRSQEQIDDKEFYNWEPCETLQELESKPNGKAYIEYCKRDVLIVIRALKALEETILELPTIKEINEHNKKNTYNVFSSKITAATLANDLLKKYVNKWIYLNGINEGVKKEEQITCNDYLRIDKEIYETISPWYSGGWTQINTDYVGEIKDIKRGCMIDVSSAYPYQMTKPLPYGELLEYEPDGIENKDYYCFMSVFVKSAKIKEKYKNVPILRNWKKLEKNPDASCERYVRQMKNFRCFYLSFEWERILKFYDIIVDENSYQMYYMKACDYLKYFSYEVYKEKDKYGKLKKDALKQMTKIILNSAYGTLAKRLDFDNFIYVPNDLKLVGDKTIKDLELMHKVDRDKDITFSLPTGENEELKDYIFSHISYNYDLFNNVSLVVCRDKENTKMSAPNKAAASVITALERCYLWDIIDKVGPQYFALSDTDSVTFININDKVYDKIKSLCGTGLGAWELEFGGKCFRYFATYGAKKYVLLDENKQEMKFKFAGLDKKISDVKLHLEDSYLTRDEHEFINVFDFGKDTNFIKNAVLDRLNCFSGIILSVRDKEYRKTYN